MVDGLLDTSVLVDVLRMHEPALQWLGQQASLGVSSIVWIELLQGARDRVAQRRALALLQKFDRIDLISVDIDWAIQQLTQFNLSYNVGGLDCLIASASYRLQLPLYSTNFKHFTPLLDTLVQ